MFKKSILSIIILTTTVLSLIFVGPANTALETQLLVDASPSSDYVPYTQTQWYGFSTIGGKGYCAILTPSTGNSDLYFFDTSFNRIGYSKNTGTTADKVWYGQATSGTMHIAGYGVYNPSSNFTVQVITAPYVKTISPTSGAARTLVTLTGYGFGATQSTSYVKFGTVQATSYYSWTNTQIKVYVPSGVASGVVQVVVYVAAKASNPLNFTNNNVSSEGTMWRYDLARTGNYPNGPTALPLNLKWSYVTTSPVIESSILVAGNLVYFISYSSGWKLSALDINTRTIKWSFSRSNFETTGMAVAGNKIYFGASDIYGVHSFYCLDANTGSLVWKYDGVYASDSSPAVLNNIAYFTGSYYDSVQKRSIFKVYALDASNGSLKWNTDVTGNGTVVISSPAIANSTVYVIVNTLEGTKIYALDANNGSIKWTYTVTNYFQCGSTPVINNNILYTNLRGPGSTSYISIFAFDANTGAFKWTIYTGSYPMMPAVANSLLYVPFEHGGFQAYDANTGALKWSSGIICSWSSLAAVSNGLVYISGGCVGSETLYALDAYTGAIKWSYLEGNRLGESFISNGKLYISAIKNDGSGSKLYCFGQ